MSRAKRVTKSAAEPLLRLLSLRFLLIRVSPPPPLGIFVSGALPSLLPVRVLILESSTFHLCFYPWFSRFLSLRIFLSQSICLLLRFYHWLSFLLLFRILNWFAPFLLLAFSRNFHSVSPYLLSVFSLNFSLRCFSFVFALDRSKLYAASVTSHLVFDLPPTDRLIKGWYNRDHAEI